MNAFIVGASGYIGKPLINTTRKQLAVYGTSSSGAGTLLRLQLNKPDEFDYKIIQSSDVVFLAAAISAPDICSREHDRAWLVNVTGTSEFIARVIARGGRVVFFSSDTVYGERNNDFYENSACNPAGDYGLMKHEVESRFIDNPSFKTIRLSYVFSSEDKFTKYLRGCAERGEEAEIFHPFFRAVVHRGDVVQGAVALAQRWGEFPHSVINFGGPDVISRIDFASKLKDIALPSLRFRQIEPDAEFFTNRPRVIQMQSPLLASLLGRPARTLNEAIEFEFGENQLIENES
jgi:dTDP-4-dehydrorhamnose reductase